MVSRILPVDCEDLRSVASGAPPHLHFMVELAEYLKVAGISVEVVKGDSRVRHRVMRLVNHYKLEIR
jgi:hypothetical protein